MKVSPSIYSSNLTVLDTVKQIRNTIVEYIHVDINDSKDLKIVKNDVGVIRMNCDLLVDVHLITEFPSTKLKELKEIAPDLIAVQYENLNSDQEFYSIRKSFSRVGISITKQTDFEKADSLIKDSDYVLLMTTVPGESGKSFDKESLDWIKSFKKSYPLKKVHVDGGIDNIVSDKLRSLKIDCIVSGSYLMRSTSMVASVLKLKGIKPKTSLRRYMTKIDYIPFLNPNSNIIDAFSSIELSQRGFCIIEDGLKWGIITDGDIRRYIIASQQKDLKLSDSIQDIVNYSPFCMDVNSNVESLLRELIEKNFYKRLNFVVLTEYNKPVGILVLNKMYGDF